MPHPSGDDHWMRRAPDRIRRGAQANGAKLTEEEIIALCMYYQTHRPKQAWLAAQFGVSRMTVSRHLHAAGLTSKRKV